MEIVSLQKCVLTQLLVETFVISPHCGKGKREKAPFHGKHG